MVVQDSLNRTSRQIMLFCIQSTTGKAKILKPGMIVYGTLNCHFSCRTVKGFYGFNKATTGYKAWSTQLQNPFKIYEWSKIHELLLYVNSHALELFSDRKCRCRHRAISRDSISEEIPSDLAPDSSSEIDVILGQI